MQYGNRISQPRSWISDSDAQDDVVLEEEAQRTDLLELNLVLEEGVAEFGYADVAVCKYQLSLEGRRLIYGETEAVRHRDR